MAEERYLVTGALGCIGSWVVRNLIKEKIPVAIFDVAKKTQRLQLILTPDEMQRIHFIQGDISNLADVVSAFQEFGVTHVIHLAALQVPFCKADPPKGATVNVVGTVNIFEAAKKFLIKNLVYASSAAVYGVSEDYPEVALAHDAPLKPRSHYGVYKQANEGTAHIYSLDDGISSIGLRPHVVYGAGRDQGMTSTPTKAMLAAAAGRPYHISYGGRFCFQYVDDVAKIFIRSSRAPFAGNDVFNVGGETVSMDQVIGSIEAAEPGMKGAYTFENKPLPFPEEMDNSALAGVLGRLPMTPLRAGVAESIQIFKQALAEGRITPQDLDLILQ